MKRSQITQARKDRQHGFTIAHLAKKYGVSEYELKLRLRERSLEDYAAVRVINGKAKREKASRCLWGRVRKLTNRPREEIEFPTPEMIAAECEKIRATWSAKEERKRRIGGRRRVRCELFIPVFARSLICKTDISPSQQNAIRAMEDCG